MLSLIITVGLLGWFLLNFLPPILILCTRRNIGIMRFGWMLIASIPGWAIFSMHTYRGYIIPDAVWPELAWFLYFSFLFFTRNRVSSKPTKAKRFGVLITGVCASSLLIYSVATFSMQMDKCEKTNSGCFGLRPPPELPMVLRDATAGSGWISACPPRNAQDKTMIEKLGLGLSPELNKHLHDQFPPGSGASLLTVALTQQGFKPMNSCENEPTIHRATFFQKGQGLLPYDTHADVYWKENADSQIIWTKGFVHFVGL